MDDKPRKDFTVGEDDRWIGGLVTAVPVILVIVLIVIAVLTY